MNDLSIIILNYNTKDWLKNALGSIEKFGSSKISTEIIVVDNASSDESVEMVREDFPRVILIESSENGGFSKGNNLGIAQAKGRYIMLLNSDAEFTVESNIEQIIWMMDQNKEIAVTTPRLQLPDGSLDLASHRGEPTPWAAVTYFTKLEQLFPQSKLFGQYHQTWQDFDQIHEIDACSGAAMVVRSDAIKEVGTLDEDFFMYAEDLDWCRRFRNAGYRIYYFPSSIIIHHKYKSGRKKEMNEIQPDVFLQIPGFSHSSQNKSSKSNMAEFHFWETMKQYYSKHYGNNNKLKNGLINLGVNIVRSLKSR